MRNISPVWRLILVAAAFGLGVWLIPGLFRNNRPQTTLLVSGNIEAHESVVSFQVQGRIVDLPVEEGKWLEQGAIIARLDDRDYRQQVALDGASVKVYQGQLTLALAGPRKEEIEADRQAMLKARADAAQKEIDFKRAETLYRSHVATREARDQAETNLKRTKAAYFAAREVYQKALAGTRPEDIAIARDNLDQARQALKLSQIKLSHTVLRAPFDGVVLVRQAELGEVVAPGTPVITLGDLDNIWLRAYVSETDLGRVRWGQKATVTTDTFPGKKYEGRVSFISSQAEFTPKSVETHAERVTLVYRIKIDIRNPNHELKPGMPADARIHLVALDSNE